MKTTRLCVTVAVAFLLVSFVWILAVKRTAIPQADRLLPSMKEEFLTDKGAPSQEPDARFTEKDSSSMTKVRVNEAYGHLPMTFEVNEGQVNSEVKFLSRGAGYNLLLTSNEAVLELGNPEQDEGRNSLTKPQLHRIPKGQSQTKDVKRGSSPQDVVRMRLIDADPKAQISGLNELPGKSNYFIGNDPKKWRRDVAHYAGVQYKEVYDGVDLIYYGNQRQLEYDFVVAPGANPGIIRFAF